MGNLANNIKGFHSSKKRRFSWYLNKFILVLSGLSLSIMLLLQGGLSGQAQVFIIPLFSLLIFFHGFYVFLESAAYKNKSKFNLSLTPLLFVPFIIWIFFNSNFISAVPWRSHMQLIFYFEAYILFWIFSNHFKKFKDIRIIIILLGGASLVHIYFGLEDFLHGRNLTELGQKKIVNGLFNDSTTLTILTTILIAGLMPMVFLRFWTKVQRFSIFLILLLIYIVSIFSHNFQGYIMTLICTFIGSIFAFYKLSDRIKYLLIAVLVYGILYGSILIFFSTFSDYSYSLFLHDNKSFYSVVIKGALSLFTQNLFFGVGLNAFSTNFYSIDLGNLPLMVDNPSNFYLQFLSELGIIGFVLFSYPMLKLLTKSWKKFRKVKKWEFVDRSRKVPSKKFYGSIFFSVVYSMFFLGMFHSLIIVPVFLLIFAMALCGLNLYLIDEFKLYLNKTLSRYFYFACTILIGIIFFLSGSKIFKSQIQFLAAERLFEEIMVSEEKYKDAKLHNEVNALINESLNQNPLNFDALLLKCDLLNQLHNQNPLRYSSSVTEMMEISDFCMGKINNYWEVWLKQGISLLHNKKEEEAERSFIKSVELAPNNFEANFYLSLYYYQYNKQYNLSRKYLNKALEIQPNRFEALELNRKLSL